MKINWMVRLKNPVWWAHVASSIVLPILTYFGLNWADMTSWTALGSLFFQAIHNPVVIVAVIMSVWNTIIDPTTKGLSDSSRAMNYVQPYEDEDEDDN